MKPRCSSPGSCFRDPGAFLTSVSTAGFGRCEWSCFVESRAGCKGFEKSDDAQSTFAAKSRSWAIVSSSPSSDVVVREALENSPICFRHGVELGLVLGFVRFFDSFVVVQASLLLLLRKPFFAPSNWARCRPRVRTVFFDGSGGACVERWCRETVSVHSRGA